MDLEREEHELLEQCRQVATLAECFTWVQRCDECIEQLEELCRAKRPRLTVGNRQSLVARIARLAGAKTLLERRFMHVGGEYASTSGSNGQSLVWREIDTAFESRILTGVVINANYIEPRQFLEDAGDVVLERVRDAVERHGSVKVNTAFNGEFVTGDKRANKSINTKNSELYRTSDVREWYMRHVVEPTLASLEEFQERDSGWALSRILNLTVNVNKNNPMHAGCDFEVPREIATKHAVINVRSNDNACFAWSVVAALHPAERHTDRESSYPHYTTVLNFTDIEFPMTLKDIAKFERLNDVSVNVFGIEESKKKTLSVLPIRLTKDKKEKHVNLLYLQDSCDNGHFTWIKNLSRLVGMQLSKHRCRKFICDRCLHYFGSSEKLEAHAVDCQQLNDCAIRLPTEGDKWLEFGNHCNKERAPFIVYADLECVLRKLEPALGKDASRIQQHEVFSIAYYVRCSYDDALSRYRFRRDNDCVAWFAKELEDLAHFVKKRLSANVPMEMLSIQQRERRTVARRVVIFAKNRSRRTTRGYAIIATSPDDTAAPPTRTVI